MKHEKVKYHANLALAIPKRRNTRLLLDKIHVKLESDFKNMRTNQRES